MHTTGCYGGIALGAFSGCRLVGYSYAVPGFDGVAPFLLSCGLAVAEGYGSRGIGESLKRAQAKRARAAGYGVIRWTTNSVASQPLHLYLSKLGGRLIAYHEDMYAGLRQSLFCDEVEIEWDLHLPARRRPSQNGPRVAIPWDRAALAARDPDLARQWLADVRTAMRELLDAGYVGTAVTAEPSNDRSLVRFERQ